MPVEVAVRQRAKLFEVAEQQTLRMGHERGKHTEPGTLVNHPVQAVISEPGAGAFLGCTLIHPGVPRIRTEARPPPEVGRRRRECPSSRAQAPWSNCRLPDKTGPPPDT